MHPAPPDLPFAGDSLLTQDLDSAIQDFLAPSEASRISLAGYDFPQEPFGPKGIDQTSPQEIAAVDDAKVSVATTFHLGFTHEGQAADVILVSSDLVNFCVVSQTLLEKSANMFASLLSTPHDAVVAVPLAANVLNVLLHAIYSLSLAMYAPSSADIALAVAAMSTYGIYPTKLIVPDSTLFQVIVHNAFATPFECYAIAASAKLEELAIAVSPYTLSKSLSELADDLVQQIGPVYLKRLFFLHLGRVEALKRLLFPPPEPHLPTDKCSPVDQRQLARAWILAVCYLTWEARPDLSVPSIEAVLRPIKQQQSCTDCREYLDQRIKKLLVDWSLVKAGPISVENSYGTIALTVEIVEDHLTSCWA